MFNIKDDLFQREVQGETNFVSVYYIEYGENDEDLQEIANLLLKRAKIEKGRTWKHEYILFNSF